MPSVAEAARILSRFADLVSLLAVLPVLSEVKFGGILRAQEHSKRAREEEETSEADGKDSKKKIAAKPAQAAVEKTAAVEPEPSSIPPSWAFLLLLVAELCSSPGLFNPKDKQVTRAFGEMARVHAKSPSGFANVVQAFEKVLGNEDVYELVRFAASVAGLGGLLLTTTLGFHKLSSFSPGPNTPGLVDMAKRTLKQFLRAIHVPRLWFFIALAGMFVVGNWSGLMKLAQRPVVAELVRGSADLLRLLAFTGSVLVESSRGPMPAWAALQVVATIARAAHYVVYNRVSVLALFEVGAHAASRGALIIKAWSVLILIPTAFKSKRFMLLIPVMALPCIVLALDGPLALQMAPFLEAGIQRIGIVVAVMSMLMVFLGGFPTMLAVLLMFQGLSRVHRLDVVKY